MLGKLKGLSKFVFVIKTETPSIIGPLLGQEVKTKRTRKLENLERQLKPTVVNMQDCANSPKKGHIPLLTRHSDTTDVEQGVEKVELEDKLR